MADLGLPRGSGASTLKVKMPTYYLANFFSKNCMKMKEIRFRPIKWGCSSLAPPSGFTTGNGLCLAGKGANSRHIFQTFLKDLFYLLIAILVTATIQEWSLYIFSFKEQYIWQVTSIFIIPVVLPMWITFNFLRVLHSTREIQHFFYKTSSIDWSKKWIHIAG